MPSLRIAPGLGYLRITRESMLMTLPGKRGVAPFSYDPTEDFSFTANPNGVWSYGSLDSTFTVFTRSTVVLTSASVLRGWAIGAQLVVFINIGAVPFVGIPAGGLALHPIPSTEPGCLRWTAPTSFDELSVRGEFLAGDAAAPIQAIRRGTQVLYSQTTPGSFDLRLDKVSTRETIDFIVYNTYNQSSTPLILTISGDGAL